MATAAVRPQDDLYRFVNGDWIDQAEIPEDQPVYGAFLELRDEAEAACREIIEEVARTAGAPEGSPGQLVGDLYASFMDTERAAARGASPMADQLAAVSAVQDVEGLLRLLGELFRDGVPGAFGFAVSTDPDDPEVYLPYLYQGGLGLPDEAYYFGEQYAGIRTAYAAHLPAIFELAGIAESGPTADAAIALETRIAAGHWDRVRSRDRSQTHNPTDRAGLDELLPAGWWDSWLAGLQAAPDALRRAEVMQPSYFTALTELLANADLAEWKAWLTARVIRTAAPFCSEEIVERNFDFYGRTLTGTPQLKPRWKRAVALVEDCVGEALGQIYVERHFAPAAKERMDQLVANLLAAYRARIGALPWMTGTTKARALEKLAAFTPKIGYPDAFRDYSGLRIDRDDLIGNARRSAALELDRDLDRIGGPVDRGEWFMTPQTVNAYYNPGMNEIVFPAAILRPPFFDAEAGDATNYGGIGAVIGHEIGHGFDDQGSKYDGSGALRDWWTADDRAAFEKLTAALIEQYSALSPDGAEGATVNGALTVGENIGDLGGLGIALRAWLEARSGQAPDAELTREFFLNWARCWRAKSRPAEVVRRLAIDPHSPPEFRCNQVVRNLDEFYSAFDVAPGDALWLEQDQRVQIW